MPDKLLVDIVYEEFSLSAFETFEDGPYFLNRFEIGPIVRPRTSQTIFLQQIVVPGKCLLDLRAVLLVRPVHFWTNEPTYHLVFQLLSNN